ncbi:hypothetical protein TNCV_3326321 [Trichonephila clavipes]|nr:hypothetical protein TNCV_3326321 [Trichonephila clavipes]
MLHAELKSQYSASRVSSFVIGCATVTCLSAALSKEATIMLVMQTQTVRATLDIVVLFMRILVMLQISPPLDKVYDVALDLVRTKRLSR